MGKKRKVTTYGINCGGSRKTRPAKPRVTDPVETLEPNEKLL